MRKIFKKGEAVMGTIGFSFTTIQGKKSKTASLLRILQFF